MVAGHAARREADDPGRRCARTLVLAAAIAIVAAGCSVNALVTGKLADALASSGTTFAADEDPILVGDALPFSLKLMESVLADAPRHEGLLLATSSGFTQYTYGWVAQEADALQDDDYEAAEAARLRAKKLYMRARDYALRALELRAPGIGRRLRDDAAAAVAGLQKDDVPVMYWTATPWILAISLSKDDPETVADLPIVEALVDRALALDEGWNGGALHGFLVGYDMIRPGLSRDEAMARAKKHLDRAVELSAGQMAAPFVSFAESVSVPTENLAEFNALIDRALSIDVDGRPEWRLQNILAQRRALWLRSRVGDLFIEAAPEEPESDGDVENEEEETPPEPNPPGGER